jgi:hypothetical protein
MKSIGLWTSLLLFAFVIQFFACDKTPEEPVDFLSCQIEGKQWNSDNRMSAEINGQLIIIEGVSGNDSLRMMLQDHDPGTYPIKNTSNVTILKTGGKTYIPLNSADGFLTVARHSESEKVIEGSFYLTVDAGQGDWKEITEGAFRATY